MKRITFFILLLVTSCVCWANGDPCTHYSAMTLSCTPEARRIPEIKLVSERLNVEMHAKYSHVKVVYVLENTSDTNFDNIDYGFPVDWLGNYESFIDYSGPSSESRQYGWSDDYVKNVLFSIDAKELGWQCSADTVLRKGRDYLTPEETLLPKDVQDSIYEVRMFEIDYAEAVDLCRKWYYTSFSFGPRQKRVLTVEYTLMNNYTVYGDQDIYIFDDIIDSKFSYDFSPSSYWGDGIARQFDLIVDAPYVDQLEISGWHDKLKKDGMYPRWMYSTKNFDLAKAAPLQLIIYNPMITKETVETLKKRRISKDEYVLTANGKNVSALSDNNLGTACDLALDATGCARILIEMKDNPKIRGVMVYYGDCRNLVSYQRSAKPDSISVYGENPKWSRFYECYLKRPFTFDWYGLTCSAEKIDFYEKDKLNIVLKGKGKSIKVSEIILLSKLPEEELDDLFDDVIDEELSE